MIPSPTTNRRRPNRPAAMAGVVVATSVLVLGISAGVHSASAETDDPLTGDTPQSVASASITVRAVAETAASDWLPDADGDGATPIRTNPYAGMSDASRNHAQTTNNELSQIAGQSLSTRRLGSGNPTSNIGAVEPNRTEPSNRLPRLGASSPPVAASMAARQTEKPESAPIGSRINASPVSVRTPPSIAWQYRRLGESPTPLPTPPTGPQTPTPRPATPRRLGGTTKQNPPQLRAEDIRGAAKIERANRPQSHSNTPSLRHEVLPGYSVEALRKSAAESISDAELKLRSQAYLTAAKKATEALQWIAQAVDAQNGQSIASHDLECALTAIRESEDFVGKYGVVDSVAIARMVRSHSTEVLKPYDTSNLNGLAAADLYLNWARKGLSEIVKADPLAVQAIRVLAHSHRLRDDGTPLGVATSVHLMRAAADSQADDPRIHLELAQTLEVAGLHDESEQAFAAVANRAAGTDRLFSTGKRSDLDLIEVSPEEFASISSPAAGPTRQATAHPPTDPAAPYSTNRPLVAQRIDAPQAVRHFPNGSVQSATPQMGSTPAVTENRSRIDQVMDPLKRLFR